MPTYAFVDSIDASPVTLLDLNDKSPLGVAEGTDTSPPQRRVSSYGSSARDGDVLAQKAYNDRRITMVLSFAHASTAEDQAEAIQALGRLLDGPQWLMWQHDGMTAPVFFRTKYGDMDVVDFMLLDKPQRRLQLTITAEPFAYGLPESGSATINNDPSHATNPMFYKMPTVKGDVATPLAMTVADDGFNTSMLLASSSQEHTQSGPVYTQTFSLIATAGWALTTPADATAIGGTLSRYTRSSGSLASGGVITFAVDQYRGDWRVLMRAKASVAGSALEVVEYNTGATRTHATALDTTWQWVDFGVLRLPASPMESDIPGSLVTGILPLSMGLAVTIPGSSTGTIDVDALLLVPAGFDDAADTRLVITESKVPRGPTTLLRVDAINDAIAIHQQEPLRFAGGLPRAVPGYDSNIHLIRHLGESSDSIAASFAITWLYYPLYLYGRPATS